MSMSEERLTVVEKHVEEIKIELGELNHKVNITAPEFEKSVNKVTRTLTWIQIILLVVFTLHVVDVLKMILR